MFNKHLSLVLLPVILMGASAPAGCETEPPQFASPADDPSETGDSTTDHSVNCQPYMAVSFRECEDNALTLGIVGGAQVIDAREIQEDGTSVEGSPSITYINPENADSPSELWMQCTTSLMVRLTILSCRD